MAVNGLVPHVRDLNFKIELMDSWLMHPRIFADGAIVGALDAKDNALYSYPEITGYYLSYLAYRMFEGGGNPQLLNRAQQILDYQQQLWSKANPPLTRHYLQQFDAFPDWRNQGIFIFDFAMLHRGIADVSQYISGDSLFKLSVKIDVDQFLAGNELLPVRWFGSRPMNAPERWSTRKGAYQLKVVAALLNSAKVQKNELLTLALEQVLPHLVEEFNQERFVDHNPHSIAYALEGALLLGESVGINFEIAKRWMNKLIEQMTVAEEISIELGRSDAIAQLLRLSCCGPFFDFFAATKIYHQLCRGLQSDGSLAFSSAPCDYVNKNTWPVLFARQALDFYRTVIQRGNALSAKEYLCLY